MRKFATLVAVFCLGIGITQVVKAAPASHRANGLVMEEFMINARDPGIQLYVRNKHPKGMRHFSPEKTLLYVHGSTYPSETAFDLPLDGMSWMDYIASRGYDVYLVDLRGYGRSTRPPEMNQPPENNPPLTTTDVAVQDVSSAVDFILARRHLAQLNLLGWSWGTSIMGRYTQDHNERVNKLVLYAPQWLRTTPSLTTPKGTLGAYRTVSRDMALSRWLTGVPKDKQATLIPKGWFDQWADATFATDPVGRNQHPQTLRAPNGTVLDSQRYWMVNKPYVDPTQIRVPTLIVHAEWDADLPSPMSHAYYQRLVNVPYKEFVEIGEGTHTIIMEKNRLQLFQAVQHFLDDPAPR